MNEAEKKADEVYGTYYNIIPKGVISYKLHEKLAKSAAIEHCNGVIEILSDIESAQCLKSVDVVNAKEAKEHWENVKKIILKISF